MKKTSEPTYTRTSYEIHTSNDGEAWYNYRGTGGRFEDTPAGLSEANTTFGKAQKDTRHVRLVHVEKRVTVMKTIENSKILSPQQIAVLVAKGSETLKGVPGVRVSEGCNIGFGDKDIVMSPTRVSVSFQASAILGKYPPHIIGGSNTAARAEWNRKAVALLKTVLYECSEKLKTAGILHTVYRDQIVLHP